MRIVGSLAKSFGPWIVYGECEKICTDNSDYPIWKSMRHSTLHSYDGGIVKKIEHRGVRERFFKLFDSQAKREAVSADRLRSMGLSTPRIYGYATSLSPLCDIESIIAMEYVPHRKVAGRIFRDSLDTTERMTLLQNILTDISIMLDNGVLTKDLHFANILVKDDLSTVWIDNDLVNVRNEKEMRFYMRKISDDRRLGDDEKSEIASLIARFL